MRKPVLKVIILNINSMKNELFGNSSSLHEIIFTCIYAFSILAQKKESSLILIFSKIKLFSVFINLLLF